MSAILQKSEAAGSILRFVPDAPASKAFLDQWCNWNGLCTAFLTFDVDWAPDYMIEALFNALRKEKIGGTFFATHDSQMLRQIANEKDFEVALHPNILPNSTQGNGFAEVMENLKAVYPQAKGNRFHVLAYSYRDLLKLHEHGIRYDISNIRFNTPFLVPTLQADTRLVTIPYFWEDGVCENQGWPVSISSIEYKTPGVKILNFHPMNAYLNSPSLTWRKAFQKACPNVLETPQHLADQHVHKGSEGAMQTFLDFIAGVKKERASFATLSELDAAFRAVVQEQ